VVEVHLTNLYARGEPRAVSLTAPRPRVIMGFGQELRAGLHELAARLKLPGGRPVNLRKKIREMVAIMREEELAEIEVRRWFTTVRVRLPGLDGGARRSRPPAEERSARRTAPRSRRSRTRT